MLMLQKIGSYTKEARDLKEAYAKEIKRALKDGKDEISELMEVKLDEFSKKATKLSEIFTNTKARVSRAKDLYHC